MQLAMDVPAGLRARAKRLVFTTRPSSWRLLELVLPARGTAAGAGVGDTGRVFRPSRPDRPAAILGIEGVGAAGEVGAGRAAAPHR